MKSTSVSSAQQPLLKLDIITIFPDYLRPLQLSVIGRACREGLVQLGVHDLRQWSTGTHRTVDDVPYGGGAGMVMTAQPWAQALTHVAGPSTSPSPTEPNRHHLPVLVIPTPSGAQFTQQMAQAWAQEHHVVMACGRYEGIDARVGQWAAQLFRVQEVSLGDFVLAGGEAAALVMAEAVIRLLPGVLGNPQSLVEESHTQAQSGPHQFQRPDEAVSLGGLLEYPVFTRPAQWQKMDVPAVLLSGDHARVRQWRRQQALLRTAQRRPQVLARWLRDNSRYLNAQERQLLHDNLPSESPLHALVGLQDTE